MSEVSVQVMTLSAQWLWRVRQAFGAGPSTTTTEERLLIRDLIRDYGFANVSQAMWDVVLRGRKKPGYVPKLAHVAGILRRDYAAPAHG